MYYQFTGLPPISSFPKISDYTVSLTSPLQWFILAKNLFSEVRSWELICYYSGSLWMSAHCNLSLMSWKLLTVFDCLPTITTLKSLPSPNAYCYLFFQALSLSLRDLGLSSKTKLDFARINSCHHSYRQNFTEHFIMILNVASKKKKRKRIMCVYLLSYYIHIHTHLFPQTDADSVPRIPLGKFRDAYVHPSAQFNSGSYQILFNVLWLRTP